MSRRKRRRRQPRVGWHAGKPIYVDPNAPLHEVGNPNCHTPHKRSWDDEASALDVVRYNHPDKPLFTYRCPTCRLWHLTSRAPK